LEFFEQFEIEFEGFNRIDIALDYEDRIESCFDQCPVSDFPRRLQDKLIGGEVIFAGKSKSINFKTSTKNVLSGWDYGQRSSDRFIRFYDKTRQLAEQQNKPHIIEYWKNVCGINTDKQVWRFEIQLNRRFIAKIIAFDEIFNRKYLVDLFRIAIKNYFDPRENAGFSRITDNPPIFVFNWNLIYSWEYVKDKECVEFKRNVRHKDEIHENTVLRNKILLKKMMFRYFNSSQESLLPLAFATEIFSLKYGFDYFGFFDQKRAIWLSQYRAEYDNDFIFDEKKFKNDVSFCMEVDIYQ
jgi:hypothetical protein